MPPMASAAETYAAKKAFIYTTPAARNSTSLIREWFTICKNAPSMASIFSGSRFNAPSPVKIKPTWETEEHAKVRFKSTENTPSTAPKNIVITPSTRTRNPKRSSPKRTEPQSRIIPRIPAFVSTPDKRADAGAGATGCAFGSHM